jgi:hypothetical protein
VRLKRKKRKKKEKRKMVSLVSGVYDPAYKFGTSALCGFKIHIT